jgi:hypothetical protein
MDTGKIDQIIDKHNAEAGSLIQILLEIQTENNWLPKGALTTWFPGVVTRFMFVPERPAMSEVRRVFLRRSKVPLASRLAKWIRS